VKAVVVAVRSSPMTTTHVHEALRMALGLTLSNHEVTVAYVGDGAAAALHLDGPTVQRPALTDSIELLDACRIREMVETDALPAQCRTKVRSRVEPCSRSGLVDLLMKADVVMTW
jgi:sulfur relay (sulfurtransferase) DsrF/TusC family protein